MIETSNTQAILQLLKLLKRIGIRSNRFYEITYSETGAYLDRIGRNDDTNHD